MVGLLFLRDGPRKGVLTQIFHLSASMNFIISGNIFETGLIGGGRQKYMKGTSV